MTVYKLIANHSLGPTYRTESTVASRSLSALSYHGILVAPLEVIVQDPIVCSIVIDKFKNPLLSNYEHPLRLLYFYCVLLGQYYVTLAPCT